MRGTLYVPFALSALLLGVPTAARKLLAEAPGDGVALAQMRKIEIHALPSDPGDPDPGAGRRPQDPPAKILRGHFRSVQWLVNRTSYGTLSLSFNLSDRRDGINIEVNCLNLTIDLVGGDAPLTQDQVDELGALYASLARSQPAEAGAEGGACDASRVLLQSARFLASAPADYQIGRFGTGRNASCVVPGQNLSNFWWDSTGEHLLWIVVGSKLESRWGDFSCMGGCGNGCAEILPGHVRYTDDCLHHDACRWYHGSTMGALDPHCGVLWRYAMDDYVLGIRCDVKVRNITDDEHDEDAA